jgi:hypothetical protein
MTRRGAAKNVDAAFGQGRLRIARAYLAAARNEVTLADDTTPGNPAMSQIVNAAIGYTDALTATYAGRANQQDHAAAVATLRDALGNRLPSAQETNLRRILSEKEAVQYGPRALTRADAEAMLARLEAFAAWAEAEMARPR